jgi:uncharacterized protein
MKRIAIAILAASALLAVTLVSWAFLFEPAQLVVREERVKLNCWRSGPLRVAVVSDLHVGSPFNDLDKLKQVVERINTARPDIIVLLGDFVVQGVTGGRIVSPEQIAGPLAALHAPLGVYAVLGNHDWWLDAPRVAKALESAHIRVLDDSAMKIAHRSQTFWLVGISDFLEGNHDVSHALSRVTDRDSVLAITHNPDVFPLIPARVCLTLAGHTHGGQVALPLIGRPIVPSKYGERYAIGLVRENGKHLFVTSGVGTSIIAVRFRVPPEIILLEISGP